MVGYRDDEWVLVYSGDYTRRALDHDGRETPNCSSLREACAYRMKRCRASHYVEIVPLARFEEYCATRRVIEPLKIQNHW